WESLELPIFLGQFYYPFLGEGKGRVVDAKTNKPIKDALVSVTRLVGGKGLLTTRKLTDEQGQYDFGGWAGTSKKNPALYEIRVESREYRPTTMRVRLRAEKSLSFADARLRR